MEPVGRGTNTLPYGKLSSSQANKAFTNADFRYTVGADGYLYAYCMTVSRRRRAAHAYGARHGRRQPGGADHVGGIARQQQHAHMEPDRDRPQHHLPGQHAVPDFGVFQDRAALDRAPVHADGVSAHSTANGVVLQWQSPVSATSTVKRATDPAGPFTPIASGLTTETYTDTTAQAGTIYYYVITATENTTDSADSIVVPGILAGSSSWIGQDIGAVAANGEFAKSGNRSSLAVPARTSGAPRTSYTMPAAN